MQLSLGDLRQRGCAIAGVVVDSVETNDELARTAHIEFPILADPELRAIDAYRLRHKGGGPDGRDIAHSASVLIDRDGMVRWAFITRNVRVRPLPADVLAAIDALPKR